MKLKSLMLILLSAQLFYTNAQILKRKHSNGILYKPLSASINQEKSYSDEGGILIDSVLSNSTSEKGGIKKGDILVEVNGIRIINEKTFLTAPLSDLKEGDEIEYKIWRNNKYISTKTISKARPRNSIEGISYQYGEIKTSFGYLRTLVSRPANSRGKLPAILFIQGNLCESVIELNEGDPYEQFCNNMSLQGFAVMRIDKPGSGESEGKITRCKEMTFQQELEQYQTGITALLHDTSIDTKSIFLFGHSLGGIITPILASKNPSIKGAMVYGTLSSNYGSYYPEIVYRSLLMNGYDEAQSLQYKNYLKEITTDLFEGNKSPQQIISSKPQYESLLRQVLGWNEKDTTILYRSLAFNRELNEVNPKFYWEKVNCPVLSIYGTSDFEAIDKEYATAMINWINPKFFGKSTSIILPDTDHAFARVGTMEEGIKLKRSEKYREIMRTNFNQSIIRKVSDWIFSL
jgi:pimeloyl-ACP methyl ester carboxylesterase